MEQQCYKRAISKHGSMSSQILLLKKADAISSAQPVQQTTSMGSFLLYSRQQALPWLETLAAHLLLE